MRSFALRFSIRWKGVVRGVLLLCAVATACRLLSAEPNPAGLVWDASEVWLKVVPKEKTAVAEFMFRNAGAKTINILSVVPSCDCLTAKADKTAYAPGESGVIRVEFAIGGREGREEKSINVVTDDAPESPHRLLLRLDISAPIAVHPHFVFWRVGEPVSEKEIEIVAAEPDQVAIGEVQCAESTFSARIERLATPGHYRVKIKPASMDKIAQATIRLSATVEGQSRVFVLYAAVK